MDVNNERGHLILVPPLSCLFTFFCSWLPNLSAAPSSVRNHPILIPILARRYPIAPVMIAATTVSHRLDGFSFKAFRSADIEDSRSMILPYCVVTVAIPRSSSPSRS